MLRVEMIDQIMEKKLVEMWHPTAELCYYVAFVLKEKLPREYGIIPYLLQMIRDMLPSSTLTRLELGFHQVTDTMAIKLAELLPCSKITLLDLNDNQITDAVAIKLAEMLPSSKLINLYLHDNEITDAGAMKLAEEIPRSKLKALDLGNNEIGDAGIIKLAEIMQIISLSRSSKMNVISLSRNQITDAGRKALENLEVKNPNFIDYYKNVAGRLFIDSVMYQIKSAKPSN